MEHNQCTWDKPFKDFMEKLTKRMAENKLGHQLIAGAWVFPIFACTFIVYIVTIMPYLRSMWRRIRPVLQELEDFRRAYCHAMFDPLEDVNDADGAQGDNRKELATTAGQFHDSSDKANGWDFGSSEDSDDYETDSDDSGYPEMLDVGDDFAQAMAVYRRKQAALARQREQVRIAETIEFDEYLLSKGLIDDSEFGKTLMVEI